MGLKATATDEEIVEHCQEHFQIDGSLEFDGAVVLDETGQVPTVSRGSDNGAYVLAWYWVDFDE